MLRRCIESIQQQTYKNIEIIVVDDNGKNTPEQIETFEEIKSFLTSIIYVVHEKNSGGSSSRNDGFSASKGDFLTFVDDDDELSETKIEKQVECLKKHSDEYGASYTGYYVLNENGKKQRSYFKKEGNIYFRALARTFYVGSGSNLLIRRKYFEKIGGYDIAFKRNQDIEFMARLFKICKVACVKERLLTVHMEVRQFKRTFEFVDGVTAFYLERFNGEIQKLPAKDKKKVLDVICLERARTAYAYGEKAYSRNLLKAQKVSLVTRIRYLNYLAIRFVFKLSFGFYY